jgi:hypothetical protein
MVSFLRHAALPELQFEACWVLTNIASGTSAHTQHVVECQAVPEFIRLLDSADNRICEQAIWALGNIAGDRTAFRDLVIRAGALPVILRKFRPDMELSHLRNSMWTVSNLFRGKPAADLAEVAPAIPFIVQVLYLPDTEVLADALWTLSYLTEFDSERVQAVVQSGCIKQVIALLSRSEVEVVTPALRTIGNIVSGDDPEFTQAILNNGGAAALGYLIGTVTRKALLKEAVWALSNILAGNHEQIQVVVDGNVFPGLVRLLSSPHGEVRREAVWAIANATAAGLPDQVYYLVNQGCVPFLVDAARPIEVDEHGAMRTGGRLVERKDKTNVNRCSVVSLEGVENILRAGDALVGMYPQRFSVNPFISVCEEAGLPSVLEDLQFVDSEAVFNKAQNLMTTYFGAEIEDGPDFGEPSAQADLHGAGFYGQQQQQQQAPAVVGGQFAFPGTGAQQPMQQGAPFGQPQQQQQQGGFGNAFGSFNFQ